MCSSNAGNRSQLLEAGVLVIAAQSLFGKITFRKQHAEQQSEERQSEFCKKITPHEFRTSTPRPGPSSSGVDSPDRIRFFLVSGGHTRPRCAGLQTDPFPTPHPAVDPA